MEISKGVSIFVYCIICLLAFVFLPYLLAENFRKEPPEEQLTKNSSSSGVLQDGALYSIAGILSSVITVFYLDIKIMELKDFLSFVELVLAVILLVSLLTWIMQYCIRNNNRHFAQREYEYEQEDMQRRRVLKKQLDALKKHLTMQNNMTIAITFPYSLIIVVSEFFSYGMSDKKGWDDFKYAFVPGKYSDTDDGD